MIILEDVETYFGSVTGELIDQKQFETWQAEHPDRAVVMAVPYVLLLHQKLPDGC